MWRSRCACIALRLFAFGGLGRIAIASGLHPAQCSATSGTERYVKRAITVEATAPANRGGTALPIWFAISFFEPHHRKRFGNV